jgi:biopolymer transport protein ExbD
VASRKKKRFAQQKGASAPELNVMPFIDIFSMLNTFLLVSASFIGLGIIEVQIPFLSNSPDVKELPARSFQIRVDVEEGKAILTTQWTADPVEKSVENYQLDEADLERMHQDLIALRNRIPDTDKVTVYADDNVKYDRLVLVLDAIKTMKKEDPPLKVVTAGDEPVQQRKSGKQQFLYKKVVMGSVLL